MGLHIAYLASGCILGAALGFAMGWEGVVISVAIVIHVGVAITYHELRL